MTAPNLRVFSTGHESNQAREIERLRELVESLRTSGMQMAREMERLREVIARAKAAHDKHDYLAVHRILKAELEGERRGG